MKGMKRFGVKGKLAPRYPGPLPILEKFAHVAKKLDLPPSLAGVHDIFHMPQLNKCLKAPVDVATLDHYPPRAPNQSLISKRLCQKAKENQFLQDSMEQPY
jgi:hypothetical protein